MLLRMKRSRNNPYVGLAVTFPEPWAVIRRPGVRLCLGDPVELIMAFSLYCLPVYTLATDKLLTDKVRSYAHYFHTIKGRNAPDVSVSYLSAPRFVLALSREPDFRALVFAAPLCVSQG